MVRIIRFVRLLTLGGAYRFLFVEVLSYQVLVVTYVSCVWNTPEAKKKVFVVFILIKDDAPLSLWTKTKAFQFNFGLLVSSELVPHCPPPDKAFSPLYAPPAKR